MSSWCRSMSPVPARFWHAAGTTSLEGSGLDVARCLDADCRHGGGTWSRVQSHRLCAGGQGCACERRLLYLICPAMRFASMKSATLTVLVVASSLKAKLPHEAPTSGLIYVMVEATQWYASGTFWAGAGAVVALLVGIAGAAISYIVGYPRRRLFYMLWSSVPLIAGPKDSAKELEVKHLGTALKTPQLVEIGMISRGRKDIPSSAYDQGRPIRLDLGTPILDILKVANLPESSQTPAIVIDGTALAVGPSLIAKGQRISVVVLTDSSHQKLSCSGSLIDVRIEKFELREPDMSRVVLYASIAIFLLTASFLLAIIGFTAGVPVAEISLPGKVMIYIAMVVLAVSVICICRVALLVRRLLILSGMRIPISK